MALAMPQERAGTGFPTNLGTVQNRDGIIDHGLYPAQRRAGLLVNGKPKYGLHAMRHFFASWCANSKESGGRGLPLKASQRCSGTARLR